MKIQTLIAAALLVTAGASFAQAPAPALAPAPAAPRMEHVQPHAMQPVQNKAVHHVKHQKHHRHHRHHHTAV